jgi:hypothetical protein
LFDGGDWNLYRYVENSPLVSTDPSGLVKTNPISSAADWLGGAVVRADQFVGQLNTAMWTGNWVDPSTTRGIGASWATVKGIGHGAKNIAVGTGNSVKEMNDGRHPVFRIPEFRTSSTGAVITSNQTRPRITGRLDCAVVPK